MSLNRAEVHLESEWVSKVNGVLVKSECSLTNHNSMSTDFKTNSMSLNKVWKRHREFKNRLNESEHSKWYPGWVSPPHLQKLWIQRLRDLNSLTQIPTPTSTPTSFARYHSMNTSLTKRLIFRWGPEFCHPESFVCQLVPHCIDLRFFSEGRIFLSSFQHGCICSQLYVLSFH